LSLEGVPIVKLPSTVVLVLSLACVPALGAQEPAPAQPPPAPAAPGQVLPAPDPATTAVESFYKLQPSDVLSVRYRYTPDYDTTVAVQPDGFITLPLVGEVKVAGLTTAEARREIVREASVRLRDPEVTVELKDFQRPRFVVGGHVEKPGQFELRGRVTLLEAVAMAGGFKTSAKHSQVILFRRYDDTRAVTRVINAKALTNANKIVEDPDLRPGDLIFVPQNRISKIERLVPFTTVGWLLSTVFQ
jgi:polysaccharide export outer membrane protein